MPEAREVIRIFLFLFFCFLFDTSRALSLFLFLSVCVYKEMKIVVVGMDDLFALKVH